jgi:hypothetical protein
LDGCPFEWASSIFALQFAEQLRQSGVLPLTLGMFRHCLEQIVHTPEPIRDECGHRWRATERAVNTAIVVERDMQCDGCGEVLDPLRERIGEPRESLAPLADRPVVPFNVACAYRGQIA